ncbi:hypothetical protein [Leptothrix cholodnii]|nr:hypothetical protein [Leptothrix cholodnii]
MLELLERQVPIDKIFINQMNVIRGDRRNRSFGFKNPFRISYTEEAS